jgi:Calpain family cysteine protease
MYMKGNIYPIVIDDNVPMYVELGRNILLMAEGANNTMWGPLLEKAYS